MCTKDEDSKYIRKEEGEGGHCENRTRDLSHPRQTRSENHTSRPSALTLNRFRGVKIVFVYINYLPESVFLLSGIKFPSKLLLILQMHARRMKLIRDKLQFGCIGKCHLELKTSAKISPKMFQNCITHQLC